MATKVARTTKSKGKAAPKRRRSPDVLYAAWLEALHGCDPSEGLKVADELAAALEQGRRPTWDEDEEEFFKAWHAGEAEVCELV